MSKKIQTQREKFEATAREIEADQNEATFNEKLAKIARQKPGERQEKKPSE